MQAARLLSAARQGDIDGALGQILLELSLLEADAMHFQRGLDRRLRIVDALARRGALGSRELPQAFELLGEQPFFPRIRTRTSSKAARLADLSKSASACSM